MKYLTRSFPVLAIIAVFMFGNPILAASDLIGSCQDAFEEYENHDEYHKAFAYTHWGKEAACAFGDDADTALKKCEETRQSNNFLSYYSKTILPPCQTYAVSPEQNGKNIVWNEAGFIVASDQYFTTRKAQKAAGNLDILLEELPLFMYREKLRNHVLNHRADTYWSIATTPRNCPNHWSITWGKQDLEFAEERVVYRCNSYLAKKNPEWAKFTNASCKCQLVFSEEKLRVPKEKIPDLLTTVATLYIEQGDQKVTLRGMFDFEISKLKPQIIKFKNKDGQVVCGGGMNPSLGDDGSFKMTCQGLGLRVSGITQVITSGKTHSIGSGRTDQGGRFIFVTALMPVELAEKYPEYFAEK